VFIHVEGTDESAHQGDVASKIKAISDVDARLLGPLLEGIKRLGEHRVMVISDHPTPCAIKTHSPEPVPFAVWPAPPRRPKSGAPATKVARKPGTSSRRVHDHGAIPGRRGLASGAAAWS
jgi:2,3-bisphosphoglycerate-independent phosphoglycerate mutase